MKVVEDLKSGLVSFSSLTKDFGIIVKECDKGLHVLNYDQINSPKAHQYVVECRGLILDQNFNVVSRSFDRFFNLGEQPDTQVHLDWSKAKCFEKVDGSLIKIYKYQGVWYISTRGTAFAESGVNGFPVTFKELVLKALDCDEDKFQNRCNFWLDEKNTYICEVTAMENRVVTRYEGYSLWFLAARNNQSGKFITVDDQTLFGIGIKRIKSFSFNDVVSCVEASKSLTNLEEGYVVYQDGVPVCKVKSPAYVAVHHIRGEGTLNPKRICQLVLMNEQDEYLKYFPEDESHFTPYVKGLKLLLANIEIAWDANKHIEDQKDFALNVKDTKYSAVLFQAKAKQLPPLKVFHEQRESYKINLLEDWVNA